MYLFIFYIVSIFIKESRFSHTIYKSRNPWPVLTIIDLLDLSSPVIFWLMPFNRVRDTANVPVFSRCSCSFRFMCGHPWSAHSLLLAYGSPPQSPSNRAPACVHSVRVPTPSIVASEHTWRSRRSRLSPTSSDTIDFQML